MRALVICLGVTVTLLLALPDTFGAPADDCKSPKSDGVVSHSLEKQSSKSSETSALENKEAKETQSRCKNGLASSTRSLSESRELSKKEEEQSRIASEKKTDKGTERVEESVKKKRTVTVSEKKSTLVYYMVSYKKLPTQNENEGREDYYKRIFPKEDNLHVFYRKIFKVYEGEEPDDYITRIEFILDNVYPEVDCRLDLNWLDQFDHYYTLKYSRKLDEIDTHYYPRVLQKWYGESNEHYKKRMECLVAALDEEDFTHIKFDDTEIGYKIGEKKTPEKSRSSPAASGTSSGKSSSKKSEEQKGKAVESASKKKDKKLNKKKKTSDEEEEKVTDYAYRMAYTRLPKILPGEDFETYYKNVFGEYDSSMTEDARNELYLRILIQYKGERERDYVRRIDYLFDHIYPQLDIRTNKQLIDLLEHYYKAKYQKRRKETDEQWYSRILTKEKGEVAEHYKSRVSCLQTVFKTIKWSQITFDATSSIGFRLISKLSKATSRARGLLFRKKSRIACGC